MWSGKYQLPRNILPQSTLTYALFTKLNPMKNLFLPAHDKRQKFPFANNRRMQDAGEITHVSHVDRIRDA